MLLLRLISARWIFPRYRKMPPHVPVKVELFTLKKLELATAPAFVAGRTTHDGGLFTVNAAH